VPFTLSRGAQHRFGVEPLTTPGSSPCRVVEIGRSTPVSANQKSTPG
jgi:hypothetical protein